MGSAPASFKKIAYFEGFNGQRPCDNLDVTEINLDNYTHIHMAFATITPDFNVNITGIQDQFNNFVKLTGVKKILSFGGWSFSTDQDTYPIFRKGVTEANRNTFIANLVAFVAANALDGLDFDWEYPGAPDIPGIPAGSPDDGVNYFSFLYYLKKALPSGITVSIAAPASFWYLKGFPINAMGVILDYIIFMTYDLHGQWDYGNAWSDPGCPAGNCLRSHINLTETINALSMITKAGVPSSKVIVGVTSYGRSFKMTKPGCVNEMCTFTGPLSGATPGNCTQTAGYISNAEIAAIISDNNTNILTYNDDTLSNILVYNDVQWVAYMDDANKAERTSLYRAYNLGGTTDWAVDLSADEPTTGYVDLEDDDGSVEPCDYSQVFATLDDLVAVAGKYSVYCAEIYAVQTLSNELIGAMANFTNANNGYDTLFGYYVKYIRDMVPGVLQTFMETSDGPGIKYFTCKTGAGVSVSCPFGPLAPFGGFDETLYWNLANSTGFYNDLSTNCGIDPTWVVFQDEHVTHTCPPNVKNGCNPGGFVWHGFPAAASNIAVQNPKDIITAAGPNMSELQNKIDATWMDQVFGQWDGSNLDVVQVLAMPVALIQQAIQAMIQVKAIGETEVVDERNQLILEIVTAVLAVVPFVGDAAASAAGLSQLARIISLIGEAANGGLTLYSIVKDPSSAPMAIFGMLLGGAGLTRDESSFAEMASLRRGMSADDLAKIGTVFTDQSSKIKKIVQSCSA
jgi:GH18 family chitinase